MSNKGKVIWVLNHYAITPSQGGGTRHYNFSKALVERGYKVYVFASSFLHDRSKNLLEPNERYREEVIDGIQWVWINTSEYRGNGKNRLLGMIDYYRFMLANYKSFLKPDIIIGSSVHLLACVAGYKISEKVGAKAVSEIRDLWPETLIDMGKIKKKSILAKTLYFLESKVYQKSSKIIVTGEGMIDYIEGLNVPRDKIVYINNSVDVRMFDELSKHRENISENSARIISENKDHFKCTYAGAIGEANDVWNLVNAAEIISDFGISNIRFVIIGEGPQKQNLVDYVREKGISNVIFYNFITKKEVPIILKNSDINIFNLKKLEVLKYGLSANKLFDYLCSAKPIVFACEARDNYVEMASAGLSVQPENPAELARAIIEIYNMDAKERNNLGMNGRKFVEDNFDTPILVDKLEEVINSL